MAFTDFLFGTGPQVQQVQRFTPQQQQSFSQILQQALGQLQAPRAGFEPIAEQARTQFEQRTIPGLAERFTAMGGQRSSAFGQQLGQAGAGLEESLASLGAQFGQQQQQLGAGLAGLGLQPQFETSFQQRQPGLLENLLISLIGAGGQLGGMALGGHIQNKALQQLMQMPGAQTGGQ